MLKTIHYSSSLKKKVITNKKIHKNICFLPFFFFFFYIPLSLPFFFSLFFSSLLIHIPPPSLYQSCHLLKTYHRDGSIATPRATQSLLNFSSPLPPTIATVTATHRLPLHQQETMPPSLPTTLSEEHHPLPQTTMSAPLPLRTTNTTTKSLTRAFSRSRRTLIRPTGLTLQTI